ncbi:MAG: c-type cytochrome [Alphaproteobacteria bacterium]|nr:c-type cytochrome [Alphaproteobacteria bacterium]MCB9698034.1 c-type cytochrome [Alphaproteobacteria bacterium]
MRILTSVMLAVALVGCGSEQTLHSPTSSSTMVAGRSGRLLAVNVDEGTVTRFDPATGTTSEVQVGLEPTRIATANGKAWVTLRGEGAVAVLDDADQLVVEQTAKVGAEPYGVVALSDGSRVYVAVSMQDVVLELDGTTLKVLRTFAVQDEPRWLALNPAETALFVASTRNGTISRIDLDSGAVTPIQLPETGDDAPPDDDDVDFGKNIPNTLTPRPTGDPVVSPDGDSVGFPTVYVDNTTPVVSDVNNGGQGYAGDGSGDVVTAGRINPALVVFQLDDDGEVLDAGRAVFLAAKKNRKAWRSYPSAAIAPDNRYFAVSMEGSDALVVVDTEPYRGQGRNDRGVKLKSFSGAPAQFLNFWVRPVTPVLTGAGPRGMVFDGESLFVHDFIDRDIRRVTWDDAVEVNRHEADDKKQREDVVPIHAVDAIRVTEPSLSPQVELGRRLFYSATDKAMVARGGGVSCATCHFDGRDDGVTWTFREEGGKVRLQTPSLAGAVSETVPLTWRSGVDSVGDEALLTTTLRMGGHGPTDEQLDAIGAFVDSTRLPILPEQEVSLIEQGRAIFESADVGCASCHAGDRGTDNRLHTVVDLTTNTPGLSGIAASAPYLHDGSLRTLRDVLEWARGGQMGDTSSLTDQEMDALEAYLRSF